MTDNTYSNAGGFRFLDSFTNFIAGLGVFGRDKAASQQFSFSPLNLVEIEAAYRGDWLSRKIIDIPAIDATREWRVWQADKKDVKIFAAAEDAINIQQKVLDLLIKARAYGGACIVLGVDGQGDWTDELDVKQVKKDQLKFIHVLTRWNISAGTIILDLNNKWYGEPSYYMRTNVVTGASLIPEIDSAVKANGYSLKSLKATPGGMMLIHPSRVIRMVGNPYPDIERAPDQWGDSCLQTVHDAVRDTGITTQSVAAMVAEAKIDIIKIPGLSNKLSTDAGTNLLVKRFSNANVAKSVINALLLDTEEEWERKEIHPEGLWQVINTFMAIASGAADIPATRLLSQSPGGQNSTGESDMRNYYDRVKGEQTRKYQPMLEPLDQALIRSATGTYPEGLTYLWNTLWQMTAAEKADVSLKKAQVFQIDVNTALIPQDALTKGRVGQLIEDGTYPGFDQAIDESEALMEEERDNPDAVRGENAPPPQPGDPRYGRDPVHGLPIPKDKPAAQAAE